MNDLHRKLLTSILLIFVVSTFQAQSNSISAVRYRIACCDWMMLKRQKLGEFALAKQVGADGVELDMGALGNRILFDNQLRDSVQARKFLQTADSIGVKISSVAMSGFFAQSLITRTNAMELLSDCFHTMRFFGAKIAFLPLGGCGKEWKQNGWQRDTLINRLHAIGEAAQQRGYVIGIRTALDAQANIQLLNEIKSEGIKIYYNFQDATDAHRNICKELQILGAKRICQIHASNTDRVNLREDSAINLPAIKKTLDRMKWKGWLVVERSRDVTRVRDVKYNFSRNVAYLKEIFQSDNIHN